MRPPDTVLDALRGRPRPVCAYVYDTAALRDRAAAVRAALPTGTVLLYAVKANGHPAVVGALARACDGLEVASGGELELAVAAGARRIAFGGPAKTDAELAAAVAAGAQINVESAHELRRLVRLTGGSARAVLRVNRAAGVPPGTHTMTGTPTPFGIDEAQLPDVLAVPGCTITGFSLHAVSNNLDAAAHAAFVADAVAWSAATAARHGIELRTVNVGGGLGVDHAGDAILDLAALRAGLSGVDLPAGAELIVEPGRILAADAGWYAAEVLDLKRTHGRTFAVLRGGTHHFRLPAAWGYSHPFTVLPVEDWPYPFPRPEVTDVAVDAVGELCTPRDVLTHSHHVSHLRTGDVLLFGRAGAYGWDISHHDFLRHPPPDFLVV
jgi:diaminopimelate decarboxylase